MLVSRVAEARNLLERARSYAPGEVFTGRKAKELGDLDYALDRASRLARIPRWIRRVQRLIFEIADRITASIEGRLIRQLYPRI